MPPTGIVWSALPWKDIIPRVVLFAHRLLRRRPFAGVEWSAEDLTWSAIEKTLSGTRVWDVERVGIIEHLMGVVSSELYNAIRKHASVRIENLYDTAAEEVSSDEQSPEDIAIKRSETLRILAFLRNRDERLAELATVSTLFGASRAGEIAQLLNVPVRGVYALQRKLREALEDYMAQQWDGDSKR
jgi:DNA-directed RNA polymerase specialized sigma24 family protein